MMESRSVAEIFRGKGYRSSRVREGMLKVFIKNKQPISVRQVLDSLKGFGLEPNKTTVYREIETLINEGILHQVHLGGSGVQYELASREHHHHAVCVRCDRIEDVEVTEEFQKSEAKIKQKQGFQILRHSLEFYGICGGCSGKKVS